MIENPIITGFNPDPSICGVGDDYYTATLTFEWFPGVQIHHSRDLANWRLVGRAHGRRARLEMRGCRNSAGIRAPCLTHAGGKFWLLCTNVHHHGSAIVVDTPSYLVSVDRIEGPWTDPVFLNASGFDPSLFHDDDGRKYMVQLQMGETCLCFQPSNYKQAAGLIACYDRFHYHYFRITSWKPRYLAAGCPRTAIPPALSGGLPGSVGSIRVGGLRLFRLSTA